MKLKQFHVQLTHRFQGPEFSDPGFEARQLIQAALNISAIDFVREGERELSQHEISRLQEWSIQRLSGMPLAYLSGKKGFFKASFFVEPGVLVPRPESEMVVEAALQFRSLRQMADFGCGSGCIGLSILQECPGAYLFAVDVSPVAIRVTNRNATALNLASRVSVVQSKIEDWSSPVGLDLVVANPPYIAQGDMRVQRSVHEFEPHTALFSGPSGLEAIAAWSAKAYSALNDGGGFVCEIGAGQTSDARAILERIGFTEIEIRCDLAGIERVLVARRRN